MFARDVFWQQIPPPVAYGENILRAVVIAVPLVIPLRWRSAGLAVYVIGLVLYVACWMVLIRWPGSAWSTSAAGLLVPAYTPVVWAAGIGLVGSPSIGHRTLPGWLYPAGAVLFTAFHLAHASIVYSRMSG